MPARGAVSVHHATRANSEVLQVGPMRIHVYEDGSRTDTRIGCVLLSLPAGAAGPPLHWHRFHDECFLVTRGRVRFLTGAGGGGGGGGGDGGGDGGGGDGGGGGVLVGPGEMLTVPPRAVHTFRNASETDDAEFFMSATPAHYVDYFRAMSKLTTAGQTLTKEQTNHVMELFGTFPAGVASEP